MQAEAGKPLPAPLHTVVPEGEAIGETLGDDHGDGDTDVASVARTKRRRNEDVLSGPGA